MPVISHVSLSIRIGYWSRRARVFLTEVDFPTRILSSLAERVTTPSDWRTCSGFPGALFVLGFWSRLGICIWQYMAMPLVKLNITQLEASNANAE